jgi:NAD+ diphosphatase
VSDPVLSRAAADRDSKTRDSEAALEAAWERAKVLVVDDDRRALVDGTELVLVGPEQAPAGERIYLGAFEGESYFAVVGQLPRKLGTRPMGLREVGAVLPDLDAGLLVHAVGLANWHATHTHCPRCGAPTTSARGGSVRRCQNDGTEHFPRTDPAVIMLVTDGADRAVLGRQASWPERRFSTLAGFVEPGESTEQAVAREVLEEAGIVVTGVTYRGSQPWPFPASLMLGFWAECDGSSQPAPNDGELAEVCWFTRQQVRDAGGWDAPVGELMLPPSISIAHQLIADWVDAG